ncbi:ankyrin repeat-containing domain protein [Xylariaceae sp. FL1272]|nr:ankyrin repeat-containing domain protein [Xylariaceae sp. FL1272]
MGIFSEYHINTLDLAQFASAPSDPTWEKPRFHSLHTIDPFSTKNVAGQSRETPVLSERAEELNRISSEFQRLVAVGVPLEQVETFMKRWETASAANAPVVQPNVLAWFGDTDALRWACANGAVDVVRLLLQKGLPIVPMVVTYTISNLRKSKDTAMLELLLDYGWDINEPIAETRPPLLCAVVDIPELAHWCLSRGADPDLYSPSGLSIIEHAATVAPLDVLKVLVDKTRDRTRDVAAVARASEVYAREARPDGVEAVRHLLDQGYPIDTFFQTHAQGGHACEDAWYGSQNALHFAIWSGKEDMVRLLLERGADTTLPTRSVKTEGKTLSPLELAVKFQRSTIVDLLQDKN